MKKTKNAYPVTMLCLLLVSLCIGSSSCKKSDASNAATTESFTFNLDGGAAITVDSAKAVMYNYSGGRLIDVFAYKGGIEILEFHFAPTTGVKPAGTVLGTGSFLTYMASPVQSFDSQSGSLTVTTCDTVGNKIVGDFNFVAKQAPYTGSTVKTITEGHMVVTKLTKQ